MCFSVILSGDVEASVVLQADRGDRLGVKPNSLLTVLLRMGLIMARTGKQKKPYILP